MSKSQHLDKSGKELLEKREKEKIKRMEARRKKHKCNTCEWGSWDGKKIYCMFPKCIKI